MDRIVLVFLTIGAFAANVCQAQTVASQLPPDRKDPSTAVMMSLVAPGGGQLYAGDAPRAARRYNAKADKIVARVEPIVTRERIEAAVSF